MATYKVEEEQILPEDTPFRARLESVTEEEIPYTDKKTGEKKSFTKLKWKFEITDGEYAGKYAYGDTDARLVASTYNKFYTWSCALLNRTLDLGQGVDPEDLTSLPCEITVVHVPNKDKSRVFANVDEVMHAGDSGIPF